MQRSRILASLTALGLAAAARATWSIILIDPGTGEIGIASATCLVNFDLQANASVVVVGKGAAAAQSFVDTTGVNRTLIQNRLAAGLSPQDILQELSLTDAGHQTRQYGIMNTQGHAVTFTGQDAGAWAGGITGSFNYTYAGKSGRMVYAIQGNVLTGAPVINAALLAAQTTDGDLPARLMASMEAARLFGGDGRCSCTTGNTQSCGSPPASFTKSADIAYMVVSRLGDSDIGSLSLPAGGSGLIAADDITGDGRPDLVVPDASAAGATRFFVFPNQTPSGVVSPAFGGRQEYPCVVSPFAAAVGDFTRDGRKDVAIGGGPTTTGAAGAVTLYTSRPDGTLENRIDIPTPRRVVGVALADLDGVNGPDLVYLTSTAVYIRLNTGDGSFGAQIQIGGPSNAGSLLVEDIAGDGRPDIIIGSGFASIRYFTNLGGGAFSSQQSFALSSTARGCVAGDFDGDGDIDLAASIAASGSPIRIILRTPAGLTAGQSVSPGNTVSALAAGDITGDGFPDLSFVDLFLRSGIARGNGDGTFTLLPTGSPFPALGALATVDLNADGYAESLFGTGDTLTVSSNSRGTLINQAGFAPGNYFLGINIANRVRTDPDPVLTMQAAFDSTRSLLIGSPDAIQSRVTLVNSGPMGKPQVAMIELRDWRGLPLTVEPRSISVERDGNGPFATAGSMLVPIGIGRYTLTLTPIRPGSDRLRIVADSGTRPVTLMPMVNVQVDHPAARAVPE